jgi:hypothetical protein
MVLLVLALLFAPRWFVRGNTIRKRFVFGIHQNVCTAFCVLSDIVKRRSVRVRITYDSLMAVVVISRAYLRSVQIQSSQDG